MQNFYWQECIPVECVPSAAVTAGGVSAQGVSAQGGVCPGDVCLGCVSKHALRQTPPQVDRMTDRCKNITNFSEKNMESRNILDCSRTGAHAKVALDPPM